MVQSVARRALDPEVGGSNPPPRVLQKNCNNFKAKKTPLLFQAVVIHIKVPYTLPPTFHTGTRK